MYVVDFFCDPIQKLVRKNQNAQERSLSVFSSGSWRAAEMIMGMHGGHDTHSLLIVNVPVDRDAFFPGHQAAKQHQTNLRNGEPYVSYRPVHTV